MLPESSAQPHQTPIIWGMLDICLKSETKLLLPQSRYYKISSKEHLRRSWTQNSKDIHVSQSAWKLNYFSYLHTTDVSILFPTSTTLCELFLSAE